jgi:hypothetical protein
MGRTRAVAAGVLGIILVLGRARASSDDAYRTLPPDASALLDEAEAVELISIDPRDRPPKPDESFHGWKILGRATIQKPQDRRAIVAALKRSVGEADKVAGCFEPRHGLRATKGGRVVDLVICFSCRWIEVHDGGTTSSVWISEAPKSAFNKALREAHVPLAQDVEGP